MNDLALWHALAARDRHDETALVRGLDRFASISIKRRAAHLGLLVDCALEAPQPEVRRAAFDALVGARGTRALTAIERGLDDDDPAVRSAALRALRAIASAEPARWLHATAHARPELRAAAAEVGPPIGGELYELPLLADEGLRAVVVERARGGRGELPAFVVPAVCHYVERGWIPPSLARSMLARISREHLATWLTEQPGRSPDHDPTAPIPGSSDPLDTLLELEWNPSPVDGPIEQTLWWSLVNEVCAQQLTLRPRIVASAWFVASKRGCWSAGGVAACLLFGAPTFARIAGSLAPSMLADALAAVCEAPHDASSQDRETAIALARAASGDSSAPLDESALLRVAATMRMWPSYAFETVVAILGERRLLAGFEAAPEAAALVVAAAPDSAPAAKSLLDQLDARAPAAVDRVAERLVRVASAHTPPLAGIVGPRAALAAALRCVEHAEPPPEQALACAARTVAQLGEPAVSPVLALFARAPRSAAAARVATTLFEALPTDSLARSIVSLDAKELVAVKALLAALPSSLAGACALAREALDARADAEVTAEAPEPEPPAAAPRTPSTPRPDVNALDDLTYVSDEELPPMLEGFLEWPMRGVAVAVELREAPTPMPELCAALLRSDDPTDHVARALALFWSDAPEKIEALDAIAAKHLAHRDDLSLLASAWLYRWERHALAFATLARRHGSLLQVLASLDRWPALLAARAWDACTRALEITATRDGGRAYEPDVWKPITRLALDELTGDDRELVRDAVARWLVALHRSERSRPLADAIRADALALAPSLPPSRRAALAPWLEARPPRPPVSAAVRERRAKLKPLRLGPKEAAEEIARELRDAAPVDVEPILDALTYDPPSPALTTLARAVGAWTDELRAIADGRLSALPIDARFEVELARAALGQEDARERASELVRSGELAATDAQRKDLALAYGRSAGDFALSMLDEGSRARDATVQWAIEFVCAAADTAGEPLAEREREVREAVERALLRSNVMVSGSRLRAALWLWRRRSAAGFAALVLDHFATPSGAPPWIADADSSQLDAIVDMALAAGDVVISEPAVVDLLRTAAPAAATAAWSKLLQGATRSETRQAAINELNKLRFLRAARASKLRAVARTFAWGIPVGLALTGRVMSIQLARDQALGYTRLDEDRIFVSALPLLRGERFGRAVVEGLVLHELGHHRYHRGVEQRAAWDTAQQEGIGPLLNLVADEHLERNLRALDTEYGDRLKKLTAYAFQHMDREVSASVLFSVLRGDLLAVLSSAGLRFARNPDALVVEHGRLLQALERGGSSFSRWVRALRMGLGDRHADEKVSRARAVLGDEVSPQHDG
jgi:hypothetical protein